MNVKKIFLLAIGFLFCLLLACQKEKSVQHGETGDVEYRFNFKVDSTILPLGVPEGENEIDLLCYDEKGEFILGKHFQGKNTVIRLPEERKISRILAFNHLSGHENWGLLDIEAGKVIPVYLSDSIEAGKKFPAKWEDCFRLGFGFIDTLKSALVLNLGLPLPMSGSADVDQAGQEQTVLLKPLVGRVILKNSSLAYPMVEEVVFEQVARYSYVFQKKKTPELSFHAISGVCPEEGENGSLAFYLPSESCETARIALSDGLETKKTVEYAFGTLQKNSSREIVIGNKGLETVVLKYEGQVLGSELRLKASSNKGSLTMEVVGGVEYEESICLRNAKGVTSWVKIGNSESTINPEEIYKGRRGSFLEIEENPGMERRIELEFYEKAHPEIVHHRLTVIQERAAAYLNLDATSLETDWQGNVNSEPFRLTVASNRKWTLACEADWVAVNYQPNVENQTIEVTVKENRTESKRNAILRFLIDNRQVKEFAIHQSAFENVVFDLKYEFNLELNTTNDQFKQYNRWNQRTYYPNKIEIFNAYPSQFGDATAKIATEAYYGFVSDAPASYNQLKINGFTSDMFVYQNYKGIAGSQNYAPGGLSITSGVISFFRRINFTLPIPAGVKSTQKVVYKMVINNIRYEDQTLYDPPVITYEIVEQ